MTYNRRQNKKDTPERKYGPNPMLSTMPMLRAANTHKAGSILPKAVSFLEYAFDL
jgi:hypothetical protein